MPTPEEAAKILRAHFGMVQDPADPNVVVGDPTGSIALSGIRGTQQSELEDRIANETSALAMPPSEGFVPGEPGRRTLSRGMTPANLVADRLHLGALRNAQASDPFTGDDETARIGGIQHTLDQAATTMRPEIGDAADAVAKRNAFAEYMKTKGMKMGEYEAAGSPEAYKAALTPLRAAGSAEGQLPKDADLRRKQEELMSPRLKEGQMPIPGRPSGQPGSYTSQNDKPFSAADEKTMNSMRGLSHMVGDLKATLDPTNNSVTNKAGQSVRLALYNFGMSPNIAAIGGDVRSQARIQLADLIKVMGAAPFMAGSRNYQYMKDIYRHLTNPAATDAFLYKQLNELEKRWPQIHDAIIQTHDDPRAPLDFSPTDGGGDVFGTEPTPEELAASGASNTNERADALLRRR